MKCEFLPSSELIISIPEEDARDLSLIKKKLDNDKYANFHAVDEDIELMLDNARAFNVSDGSAWR